MSYDGRTLEKPPSVLITPALVVGIKFYGASRVSVRLPQSHWGWRDENWAGPGFHSTHWNQNTSSLPCFPYGVSKSEILNQRSALEEFENHWLSLCWLVCHSDGIIQVPCSRDDEVWRKVPQVIKLILFKQHWILKDPHKRLRTSVPFEAEHIIYNMNTQMSVLQQMKIIPVNHKSLLLTSWFIIMFQLVKVIWSSWTISFRAEIAPNI